MFCDQCGRPTAADATVCPHCGSALAPVAAIPRQRQASDHPVLGMGGRLDPMRGVPPARVWLAGLSGRNLRGTVVGIVAAWFNVPFVILMAGLGAIVGGLAGVVSGTVVGVGVLGRLNAFLTWVFPLPVSAEQLLPTAAAQIGGILGGLLGAVSGAVKLAWMAAVWPWEQLYAGDPTWPFAVLLGQIVVALFVGALYVGWCSATEGWRLRVAGARRPSRREAELLDPIVAEVAARLGLSTVPHLLIDDRRQLNAVTGLRHLVIYQGLLDEVAYDRTALAGVIAHELAHWRDGDAVALAWSKGVALPLYLLYGLATRLLRAVRVRPLQIVVRILLWSVLVTVDYLVIPVQAAVWRRAEYRADAAAADAGYGDGLRLVLGRLRTTFDGARDGWDAAVCATHPPTELRLERLEQPGRRYGLGADAGLPAVATAGHTSVLGED